MPPLINTRTAEAWQERQRERGGDRKITTKFAPWDENEMCMEAVGDQRRATFVRFSHAAAKCNRLRPKLSLGLCIWVYTTLFPWKNEPKHQIAIRRSPKILQVAANQSQPKSNSPLESFYALPSIKLVSLVELRFGYSVLGIGSLVPCRLSSNQLCNRCS